MLVSKMLVSEIEKLNENMSEKQNNTIMSIAEHINERKTTQRIKHQVKSIGRDPKICETQVKTNFYSPSPSPARDARAARGPTGCPGIFRVGRPDDRAARYSLSSGSPSHRAARLSSSSGSPLIGLPGRLLLRAARYIGRPVISFCVVPGPRAGGLARPVTPP